MAALDFKSLIVEVEHFGVRFKDVSPLLRDPHAFDQATWAMAQQYFNRRIDRVACIDARGFIFGTAVARHLRVGIEMLRKPGKLPGETTAVGYEKEYGIDQLAIQTQGQRGERFLVVDDVLARGGTAEAAKALIEAVGGVVVGYSFAIELVALQGRKRLDPKYVPIFSLVEY